MLRQYEKGVQYGFENVKAYVLARDNHCCQSKKKGCNQPLETHHIQFRSQGGSDVPANLVTLCSKHADNAIPYNHRILLLLKESTMFQKVAKTKALILSL